MDRISTRSSRRPTYLALAALGVAALGSTTTADRAKVAAEVRDSGRITLLDSHVSGQADQATAKLNIAETAEGKKAKRSRYGMAPGCEVDLDTRMLQGMLDLTKTYSFRVTEVAGGSHSQNSRHYVGVAFDVDQIDGKPVNKDNPSFREFMEHCRKLGATEVLGPGAAGHDTHVHAAWPRS
jgi:zinc D-Ala-D-Ala carboxypeptidase